MGVVYTSRDTKLKELQKNGAEDLPQHLYTGTFLIMNDNILLQLIKWRISLQLELGLLAFETI